MRNMILVSLILAFLGLIPGNTMLTSTNAETWVYDDWGIGKRKFFSPNSPPESQIREVFKKEIKEHLENEWFHCQSFENAIEKMDVKQSSEIVMKAMPLSKEKINSDDSKKKLKVFSALVATNYLLSDKEVFNAKNLWLLGSGYEFDNERCWLPNNIFSDVDLINTAELLTYWHWVNYDPDKGKMNSTMLDYSPFTEKELSLLYWSHILFNWMKLEYKSEIATELVKLNIVELVDGEYKPTEKWSKKLEEDKFKDEYNNIHSKVAQKYDFYLKPWVCTLYILDRINNKSFKTYDTYGHGGGKGHGGGVRCGHIDWFAPEYYPIDEKLIPEYQKEKLLDLEKIKELLKNKVREAKFRGVVHLFRHINKANDYSLLNILPPALCNYNKQRYNYIVEQLNGIYAKASKNDDQWNIDILITFLHSLFENENIDRPSVFLKVIIMTKNNKYTEEFINMLFDYKIEGYDAQIAIINYIVESNHKDLIPMIFDWAYNSISKDQEVLDGFTLIALLVRLDRDKTLTYANKVLIKSENVNLDGIECLGKAVFNEITDEIFGERMGHYDTDTKIQKFVVDPVDLDRNELFFKNAHLYTNLATKRGFYQAVAQNCNTKVDDTVFKWFRMESDAELKMEILQCYAMNILKLNSIHYVRYDFDEETVDKKALRAEILENRDRYKELVDIALNENSMEFDNLIKEFALYLQPEDAWSIYEKLFERYKYNKQIRNYIYKGCPSSDVLNIIDTNELTWNTYQYLIKNLASEESDDLIPEFFKTALTILTTQN